MIPPIDAASLARLKAFRGAARQVREATIIDKGQAATVNVWRDSAGHIHTSLDLLDREAFKSLVVSLRLVYQQGEPASFYSICNIARRHASERIQDSIDSIRRFYRDTLGFEAAAFVLKTEKGERLVRPGEIFEAWMYGEIFHQNPDKQELLQLLRDEEGHFLFNIQATVTLLCGRVLDLDDIIADLLGEPRVPRITSKIAPTEDEGLPVQTPPVSGKWEGQPSSG